MDMNFHMRSQLPSSLTSTIQPVDMKHHPFWSHQGKGRKPLLALLRAWLKREKRTPIIVNFDQKTVHFNKHNVKTMVLLEEAAQLRNGLFLALWSLLLTNTMTEAKDEMLTAMQRELDVITCNLESKLELVP